MRRGMTNYLQIRVKGLDLTECTDMILMVQQDGITDTYTGTANPYDTEVMDVTIPKADAMRYKELPAKFQVALTDKYNVPRSHKPILEDVGGMLRGDGYGV